MSFIKNYEIYETLPMEERKNTIGEVVAFFEEKTIQYILSNLKREIKLDKAPVAIQYVGELIEGKNVSFASNTVYIYEGFLAEDKQSIFYEVAHNTVCAIFLCLFSNTAANPKKKTSFSKLSSTFTASIASEFALGTSFAQDIMSEFAMEMSDGIELAE